MTKPVAAGKSSFDFVDRDLLFEYLAPDRNTAFLDLACGAGRYTLALAERMTGQSVIHALDLWAEGIRSLQESAQEAGLETIHARVADLSAPLPLETDSVDCGLMATILHDLPAEHRDTALAEAARIIRPGGSLVVVEFKKLDHGPGPGIDKRLDADDIARLAARHGLTRDRTDSAGEYVYLIRLKAE